MSTVEDGRGEHNIFPSDIGIITCTAIEYIHQLFAFSLPLLHIRQLVLLYTEITKSTEKILQLLQVNTERNEIHKQNDNTYYWVHQNNAIHR